MAIEFPFSFFLIFLFRKSRVRKPHISRIEEAILRMREEQNNLAASSEQEAESRSSPSYSGYLGDASIEAQLLKPDNLSAGSSQQRLNGSYVNKSNASKNSSVKNVNELNWDKKPFSLPWGFRIIAWVLLIGGCVACGYNVWAYGIQFGDETCKLWITSILVSFLTSTFLSQPLKVVIIHTAA